MCRLSGGEVSEACAGGLRDGPRAAVHDSETALVDWLPRAQVAHQQIRRRDERAERDEKPCTDREEEHECDQKRGRRDYQEHQEEPGTQQQDHRRPRQGDEEDPRHCSLEQLADGWTLGRDGAIVQARIAPRLFRRLLEQDVGVRFHN
jgi:hypothetical protein